LGTTSQTLGAATYLILGVIALPIASYAVNPEGTAALVDRFAAWMKANKIAVIGAVIAVVGVVLIVRGLSRLS